METSPSNTEHFDVVIVGAGISGIGAACHLSMKLPEKAYVVLEGRDSLGGTWDLFRYPGIRSDSDMLTLGYSFRPWTGEKTMADGPSILQYLKETAQEYDVLRKIRFGHKVRKASWSSERSVWTLEIERASGERVTMTCSFLFSCTGYYRYDKGYSPELEGMGSFKGRIVHPQHWPEDLDYKGKRVVVIGSGATAITLVPAMAHDAAHVVMLQRSPTYVLAMPTKDPLGPAIRRALPEKLAYRVNRWKNILLAMALYEHSRRRPEAAKKLLKDDIRKRLGPGVDVDKHFSPHYQPWDQRLCIAADGDFFDALSSGKAEVATDTIARFTEKGLKLSSGQELEADIVVMATGLSMLFLGGMELQMDGRPIEPGKLLIYKGVMLGGVPNFALAVGYTNASWTLKVDLTCEYVCRLLRYMDHTGAKVATPEAGDGGEMPLLPLSSGYIQRALDAFPKQGLRKPWKVNQNYFLDIWGLRLHKVDDGTMRFDPPGTKRPRGILSTIFA